MSIAILFTFFESPADAMNSSSFLAATASSSILPAPTVPALLEQSPVDEVPAHHANPVVAFMIGLGIVMLASIMNAAGLNLTKLDHVCLFCLYPVLC